MRDIEAQIQLGYQHHSRLSEFDRLVYPVVSRRSGGLSLGINLNPDKRCNFDCVYCQVERTEPLPLKAPDLAQLERELRFWLERFRSEGFRGYRLQDIALAGDGEPTVVRELPAVLALLQQLQREYRLDGVRLVLFTNGSGLGRADLASGWPAFFQSGGELWFKLDYWDQESLQRINRTRLQFARLWQQLIDFGRRYPVILQSCFFCWQAEPLSPRLVERYLERVRELLALGVDIRKIQAYTLARQPAEAAATPWSDGDMRQLGALLRQGCPLAVELYFEQGGETG